MVIVKVGIFSRIIISFGGWVLVLIFVILYGFIFYVFVRVFFLLLCFYLDDYIIINYFFKVMIVFGN